MARKSIEAPGKSKSTQCAFNDHGYLCQNDGHLATSVHGDGPWYCRQHFAAIMGWEPWPGAKRKESMQEVDQRVVEIVPRIEGESDRDWSIRCREWALNAMKRPLFQAEPGERG